MKLNLSKLSPPIWCAILLAIFCGVSLYLRVGLPYDTIFTAQGIKFAGIDVYSHIRLIDNIVHNFPHISTFDPYLMYPGGQGIEPFHFFNLFLAGIIWLIGLGSPTEHTIDVVSVWFPAILGTLIIIPVYFIGKELFGRWAGIISAGLIAILPGEILGRSVLGFTDSDIFQILLTTVAILFLILAIKTARQRQWTFSHLKHRDWAQSTKPILYSLLAGIFLGSYILTWQGALLFVFIISVYLVIQFIFDHLRHRSTEYLCLVGVILFFITLIISLLIPLNALYRVSLIIALFIPLVLGAISWFMAGKSIRTIYYPLTIVVLGLAGLAVLYFINTSLFSSMVGAFGIFNPTGASAITTIEMQSILFPGGDFTFVVFWNTFTTGSIISVISLLILGYLVVKRGNAEKSLLVVWSLIILIGCIGQRRFASYYAVNVALLTGYFTVLLYPAVRWTMDYFLSRRTGYQLRQVLEFADLGELVIRPAEYSTRLERKKAQRIERKEAKRLKRGQAQIGRGQEGGFRPTIIHTSISLWVVVVFFLTLFPNIPLATTVADSVPFAPSDAWCSSLSWLRESTPEPFGDPDVYYRIQERPPPGQRYEYPESAYGVLAWWDYGYWITRIAHRIPNANPGQKPRALTRVAKFFVSQNERSASRIARKLGSSYIVMDYATANTKFWAIAMWAGRDKSEYFDIYYVPREDQAMAVQLYYPEFYRSFSTRLFNFDGKEVNPEQSVVISYRDELSQEGIPVKLITGAEQFDSYEEAEEYLLSQETDNYRIVSDNPFASPVPLKALEDYRLIHSSNGTRESPFGGEVPEVKIFEFVGR